MYFQENAYTWSPHLFQIIPLPSSKHTLQKKENIGEKASQPCGYMESFWETNTQAGRAMSANRGESMAAGDETTP